ncbi:hypothetical protein SIAM614_17139 [Stappia aggregata IAM 12614]|uniref:Uncharacterized protein n=1 Tax=Roseibium aggregatum (strain ATCC 25650 / DSM 13394 / JCM 20685 / NBRC 16684 / NCIMB 2208 / IAM 12614 / B1) TaxID=384765 RepID=A0P294_ROSAI|nr:hypothetical protein SIAM614_17139 [Stappia aggregata IAM 12614] [Roseibium aggregatum IAM 12614]
MPPKSEKLLSFFAKSDVIGMEITKNEQMLI